MDTYPHIRERVVSRISPDKAKLFVEYFTVEKLQDFDNWTQDDVDLYATIIPRFPD